MCPLSYQCQLMKLSVSPLPRSRPVLVLSGIVLQTPTSWLFLHWKHVYYVMKSASHNMGGGVLDDSINLSVTHIDGYKLKEEVCLWSAFGFLLCYQVWQDTHWNQKWRHLWEGLRSYLHYSGSMRKRKHNNPENVWGCQSCRNRCRLRSKLLQRRSLQRRRNSSGQRSTDPVLRSCGAVPLSEDCSARQANTTG